MMRLVVLTTVLVCASVLHADDKPKSAAVQKPELRSDLLRRAQADQKVRGEIVQWMTQIGNADFADEAAFEATLNAAQRGEFRRLREVLRKTDQENTARVSEIVEQYGWPTQSLVGRDGANAAWLLVQHADSSPAFQRKCLDLMARLPDDEISRKDLAYLTDRVLLSEGKKQVYGTQFEFSDGKCRPRPIADEASVDQRRKDVGLEPLAEYLRQAETFYGGKK